MEVFPFDPRGPLLPVSPGGEKAAGMMLYDYQNRGWDGMAARFWIPLADGAAGLR